MSTHGTRLALAKVLVAAAWADGHVDPQEMNAVKAFMTRVGLSEDDVREVSALLQSPIPESEAERLTLAFLDTLPSGAERHELLDELERLVAADGSVSEEETRFLAAVRDTVDTRSIVDVVLGRVRGLVGGLFGGDHGRPSSLADLLRARLQDRVRERLRDLSRESERDAETLNRAALFGAILQKVAYADGVLSDAELDALARELRDRFGFSEWEVTTITDVVGTQVTEDVDVRRLVAEYNRLTEGPTRTKLLEALFHVAYAEDGASEAEIDEIRRIADFLWIDRRTFNDIRLRQAGR